MIKKIFLYVINFIIIFGFLFEIELFSIFTTRRICAFISIVYCLFYIGQAKYILKYFNKKYILIFFICMISILFIWFFNTLLYSHTLGNRYFESRYVFYEIIYILGFSIYCNLVFKNYTEFSKIYIPILLLQTIIVFFSLFNPTIREILYNICFVDEERRLEKHVIEGTRIVGWGLMASLGSLILNTGCIVLIIQKLRKEISPILFSVLYLIICCTTIFIGRTGFYLNLLFWLYYLCNEKKYLHSFINLLTNIAFIYIMYVFLSTYLDARILSRFLEWGGVMFTDQRFHTLKVLSEQKIPDFSYELIFGTNVMTGIIPNGQSMTHDSGVARLYTSIGIIGTFIYYLAFFYLYFSPRKLLIKKKIKNFLFLVVLISFLIEFKEPFILKYIYTWFIFTTIGLISKEKHCFSNIIK